MNVPQEAAARRTVHWFRFSSPPEFYRLAGWLAPACFAIAALLGAAGLWLSFFVAPTDQQQGDAYRIMFIHVPAAWMAMIVYLAMAFWAAMGIVFNTRISAVMALGLAPTGAFMAFLALWTGALWGRPTWGTYWDWDARMTSTLLMLFLYLGFLALHGAIDDLRRADRAAAILALVGVVNVPLIYFSVNWWNSLHQGSSITLGKAPTIAAPMLRAMFTMVFAVWAYCIGAALTRARAILLERERDSEWVRALPSGGGER